MDLGPAAIRQWLAAGRAPDLDEFELGLAQHLKRRLRLPPRERQLDWATLAAAAVAIDLRSCWDRVVAAFVSNDLDFYQLQRDSGMSRDDLGEPMSTAAATRLLGSYTRSVLEEAGGDFAARALLRVPDFAGE